MEIADAVELWARRSGRHATIGWVPTDPPTPQVRITLKPDDGRLEAYRQGLVSEEPVETVELVDWEEGSLQSTPLNLGDLGVSGVMEILEKGDTWSGRGEYDSLQQGVTAARRGQKARLDALQRHLRAEARHWGAHRESRVKERPAGYRHVPVLTDVTGEGTDGEAATGDGKTDQGAHCATRRGGTNG